MKGAWHGLHVEENEGGDGDRPVISIFHPHTCSWSTEHHHPTNEMHGFFVQNYTCDVQFEYESVGFDDEDLAPGFYWLRIDHITHPSGPWGPTEYDQDRTWLRLVDAKRLIEPMNTEEHP